MKKTRSATTVSKQAIDAPRSPIYMAMPEDLVLVGIDVKDDGSVFNDERLELPLDAVLLDSIMRFGVKKNVIGRKNISTGKVEITDGRQRVRCARRVNEILRENNEDPLPIPVRVERGDDNMMSDLQVTLNHYVQSTPLMKARSAGNYLGRGKSIEETCRIYGISEATLNNWTMLLNMDKAVHDAVDSGRISSYQALKLVKLSREEQKVAVAYLVNINEGIPPEDVNKADSSPSSDPFNDSIPSSDTPRETVENALFKVLDKKNPSEDRKKIPSKADLTTIVVQGYDKLDPNFILGLKYALGMVGPDAVPGLKELKKGARAKKGTKKAP